MWDDSRSNFEYNLAVIIGINDYQNGVHELSTPVNDARVLADLLETEYKYQEVIRLFPPHAEATQENLDKLLFNILPNKIKPTEADAVRLLFYFAGHGTARNSKQGLSGYLLPQDADPLKLESFFPMKKLYDALAALDCHHLLVILDCCFAGTFRWSSIRNVIPIPETIHKEHYDRFIRYRAWQVISSAAYNQEALDVAPHYLTDPRGMVDNSGHSPFAMALIQGLSEQFEGEKILVADLSKDGIITAPELYIHLRDCVEKWSNELQTPGLWPLPQHDRGEFVFTKPNFNPNQLTPAPELDENNNPYRGLKPYDEEHARFFFGRQELIQQLSVSVSQPGQQLTTVVGISGSGKSSLVKAGLIPYLRKNKEWHILEPMRPSEFPFAALARTILAIANETLTTQIEQVNFLNTVLQEKVEQFEKLATIWNNASLDKKLLLLIDRFEELKTACRNSDEEQQLEKLKNTVQDYLKNLIASLQTQPQELINIITAWSQVHPNVKLLLIIDQFEELITLRHNSKEDNNQEDKKEWWQFLNLLAQTLKSCPQFCLVLTLRSDFETRFIDSPLNSYWAKARFPVRPMRSDELRQAIVGPASEMALYFEPPNLVDQLIDEVGQMPGALPLLSFTLSELYIKLYNKSKGQEKPQRILTIDENFERQGGVAGSITSRANAEYALLANDAERTTMRRVMLRLLTIEGWDASRRQVPDSELVYYNFEENQRVTKVIEHLVQARLVVKGQETGEPYVEPAHDFLVRGWDKLQDWIKENRDELMLQQRLTPAANDWYNNGRRSDLLWPDGDRLNQVEKILNQENNWLNQRERDFINNSIEQFKKLRARPELQEKASRVLDLLPVQPLEGLVLAIQAMGQNLETLPEEMLSPVQNSLHQAMEIVRERNIFQRHKSDVTSVAISSDGQYIVSGSHDKTVRLWDKQGNQIGQSLEHEDSVTSVAISSDGQYIITGCLDGTVYLWNFKGKQIVQQFQAHEEGVTSVAISSNGQYIVTGSYDNTVRLWDKQGNQIGQPLEHEDNITSVAISSDGQHIASGSSDGVRLSNAKGEQIGQLLEHGDRVSSVAITSDGQMIVSGSWDGKVYLWNVKGQQIGQPFQAHDSVWSVAISPNGQYIVSGGEDKTVRLWDTLGKQIGQTFRGHKNYLRSVAISPDGQYIVSASEDKTIRLWDTQSHQISQPFQAHKREVTSVAISWDSKYIFTISNDNTVRLWDKQGNPQGQPFKDQEHKEHRLRSVAISPDGQYIVVGSEDTTVRLYDTQGIPQGQPFQGHTNYVTSVAISSDGQYIVSASEDETVRLWNFQGNRIAQPFKGHHGSVYSVAISWDGQYIVSGGDDATVRLWDRQGNQICEPFKGHEDAVTSVVISTDGRYIVSGSKDTTVRLWNTQGKQIAQPFQGHNNWVNSVAISSDGRYIISGGEDETVRLWDTQGNQIGQPFRGHQGSIYSIVISSDGQHIVSGGFDGTVRLWRCGNWQTWLKVVCDRLRYHPVFIKPDEIENSEQRRLAIEACETCKKYVWDKANSSV